MVLVFVEHDRGQLNKLSLEALTFGRQLAGRLGAPLQAVWAGPAAAPAADLGAYGVAALHVAQSDQLADYAPAAWAQCVAALMVELQPAVVLAAGTDRGNEVLAHVAARAGLPLAANCTAVEPGEAYTVTRLRWGGSLLEQARLSGAVKLLTVAPQAVAAAPAETAAVPTVRAFTPELSAADLRVRVVRREETGAGKVSLAEARVVVGGGRGVGSAEGFQSLEELAGLLGGVVGCSRAVTSLGWRPHAEQIGQTGNRITADLYIACGVSGAIQHWVGCKGAKVVLAVNTDREAPIVTQAHYAVIGDLHQVLPAITAELKKARGG